MDVRPQAHDIIRTWLFSTVLRSHLEHGSLPWAHAAISGWVLDPDRKKMSKSKGNVVTPMGLLEEHGSDGVRYWAASARPGTDTAFDPAQMKVGRRLAIKLLNAVEVRARPQPSRAGAITAAARSRHAHESRRARARGDRASSSDYDYARVLQHTETFFWDFCDNYLELVKSRRYGDFGDAAGRDRRTPRCWSALSALLRLFAPYLPFVDRGSVVVVAPGTVHAAAWPTDAEVLDAIGGAERRCVRRCISATTEVLAADPQEEVGTQPVRRRVPRAGRRPLRRRSGADARAGARRPAGGVQGRCARDRRPAPEFDVEVFPQTTPPQERRA